MEYIDAHWDRFVELAMIVAMLINGHTPNWKTWPGRIGKFAGLVIKIVSLWTADKPKDWDPKKDPDRRSTPPPIVTAGTIGLVVLVGCANPASTISSTLDSFYYTADGAAKTALPVVNQICLDKGKACVDNGIESPGDCPELLVCRAQREQCVTALKSTQLAVAAGKMALAVDDLDGARKEIAVAGKFTIDARRCFQHLYGSGF